MKRRGRKEGVICILVLTFLLQCLTTFAFSIQSDINIKVNNTYYTIEPEEDLSQSVPIGPIIYQERLYLPMQVYEEILEIKGEITYTDKNKKQLTIISAELREIEQTNTSSITGVFPINASICSDIELVINGEEVPCEIIQYKGKTYLPLRVLADALKINIDYNEELKLVLIGDSYVEPSDYECNIDNEIQSKLEELRQRFPHNKYWNAMGVPQDQRTSDTITDLPCNHKKTLQYCNRYEGSSSGKQCKGFAAKISDEIFGVDAPQYTHTSFEAAKVGDNIRIKSPHSMIILEKHPDYVIVVEVNNDGTCRINWDRKVYRSSLEGATYTTRY